MDSEYKSFIKIFITGCLWGTIGLFVKLMEAQGSSSPYTSFLRLLFGFILLALMTLIIDGPKAFCIGRRTLPVMSAKAIGTGRGKILLHGGNDSYIEEFFDALCYLQDRGFDVYLFEGPGQGGCLREKNMRQNHRA